MSELERRSDVPATERHRILERHINEITDEFQDKGWSIQTIGIVIQTDSDDEHGFDSTQGFATNLPEDATGEQVNERVLDLLARCYRALVRTA